ncbi:stimulator of interferon genes protein isoform X2 [Leuresthes tenuis]|uniref:stimulator of interferon genes protein isoform X2 n=1 Tax=Leuresthes tenuis TaxID=355514 RepID=UPI003B50BE35
MQSLRDQDALIPQPRGNLTTVCAVVLVVVTIGSFVLMSPQGLFGCVVMAILTVTLGPLLHGVCLLTEETVHHSNRYHGRALLNMLPACGLSGTNLLIPGLAVLLLYLTEHTNQYQLIFLVPVIYTVFKRFGILCPSEVEVSEICESRKMNVAHGLAWSFYLGYLKLVLPCLEDSIIAFCATHQASSPLWGRSSRKLLILIPLDTNIPDKLEEEDDNIHFYDNLPNIEKNRAGVRNRVYKHSVYRVHDEHGRVHDCVVEYATPLLTFYRMSQERMAGFGEPERRQQVLLFYRTLQHILDQSLECRNRYKLILLNDERKDDPHFLSKAILGHLEQQEKEEFNLNPPPFQETQQPFLTATALPPNEEWHRPELMSREPTLMISLEQPQPLREPVENTDHYLRGY